MSRAPDVQKTERVVAISAEHPCLPGHFPGRPIVPAVVILDEVRAMIADHHSNQQPVAIDHCKFQDVVLPDHPFRIVLRARGETAVDFTCSAADDDRLLVTGRMSFDPVQAAA